VTCLALPTPYRLEIANFPYLSVIERPRSGWHVSNLWKSFTGSKTRVFQAADGKDLVILACTVFDWSTRMMDGQTDGQTELRWLRRATGYSSSCCRA